HDPPVGCGRKLLMFSDSRQNAAFMASYLQDFTREFLIRELAWDGLRDQSEPLSLNDWALATQHATEARGLAVPYLLDRDLADLELRAVYQNSFAAGLERRQRLLEALLAAVAGPGPLTLEALGLVEVRSPLPPGTSAAGVLPDDWPGGPAAPDELADLLARVFRLMRRQYMLTCPDGLERPGFTAR